MIASFNGATELPSPVISVVMPWKIFDGRRGSTRMVSSDWPSMSMKPGATTMPLASMVRLRWRSGEIADGGDLAVADAKIAGIPGRAGAVDDVAVGDDDVESLRRWWRL